VKPFESMELLARVRVQVRLRQILREKIRLQKEVEQSRVATLAAKMARGVAHNYLNLLTGIQGYVGLMEFAVGADRELVDHLQQVKELIARATRMTNDLSACAGLVTIQREEVYLSDLFAELFRPLEEWGGKWRLHVQEISGTGSLSCHLKQLRRVMTILFTNAAEAMPSGGTITLQANVIVPVLDLWETGPPQRCLQIQIQDHGKGMPACEAEKVFQPFFTTKATVGSGLSLAVAQAIVQSHGGHLQFESRLGCGSRVTLRLPLHERETRLLSSACRESHLQIQ
jgi:signal transduction histidine kinase